MLCKRIKNSLVHVNVVEVLCSAKEGFKPYSLIWSMPHWTFFLVAGNSLVVSLETN